MSKILVAEDESMILKVIEFRLRKEGFEVIAVSDGKEAMDALKAELPDLILTDIMMPFFSGLEIINYVRNTLHSNVPIIILSSAGYENTVVEAFKMGADDFITKPFNPNELSIRVRKNLERIKNQ